MASKEEGCREADSLKVAGSVRNRGMGQEHTRIARVLRAIRQHTEQLSREWCGDELTRGVSIYWLMALRRKSLL